MILGLDVGGTQTDAVLLDRGSVLVETKTPTGDNLLETLRSAISETTRDFSSREIRRTAFSTTMATNAIVQDRLDETGMIVSAGPGMDPQWFSVGPAFRLVGGCLDHQGFEAAPLEKTAVLRVAEEIRNMGIHGAGIVGKFSVRNPMHELQIADWVGTRFSHLALGHLVSGSLNFPRRIATSYLNGALYRLHEHFIGSLRAILDERGLKAPRYLLKPDGGTVDLNYTLHSPAGTAQSGPAASVMGALALDGCRGTSLVLDIGGTTTDMTVVLDGVPLLEPHGIRLGTYQTLIRSLLTHSIGVGGDSEVKKEKEGRFQVGPARKGPPVALGGTVPTPTDAMITLELLRVGHPEAARDAMKGLGSSEEQNAEFMARQVLESMANTVADAARAFVNRINSRPVYTIHEVLQEQKIAPDAVVVIGGPAQQIAPFIGQALGLPFRVPDHSGVANAVGAAVARVTTEITLQADTQRGALVIPEAGVNRKIPLRFNVEEAMSLGREALQEQARQIGAERDSLEISVTEQQVFNMVRGFSRAGQNIRLKLSITPGLIGEWNCPGEAL